MDTSVTELRDLIERYLSNQVSSYHLDRGELTIQVSCEHYFAACEVLRDEKTLFFEQLTDLCGVDYLDYGVADWSTKSATLRGFGRAVEKSQYKDRIWAEARFAVVAHLLSVRHNWRLRIRTFVSEKMPIVSSVTALWASANWFEREAFDLFGILFDGHPDLRRILTDYGFIGHPFRKDFPLSGNIEMRYDPVQGRVIYEPVSIEPRTLVPRVIRDDHRYQVKIYSDKDRNG